MLNGSVKAAMEVYLNGENHASASSQRTSWLVGQSFLLLFITLGYVEGVRWRFGNWDLSNLYVQKLDTISTSHCVFVGLAIESISTTKSVAS